jgi:hypothetical protein
MATNGYARITAGVQIKDFNPNKSTSGAGTLFFYINTSGALPVSGYSKVAVYLINGQNPTWSFLDASGNTIQTTLQSADWSYYDVPSNAVYLKYDLSGKGSSCTIAYSMLA